MLEWVWRKGNPLALLVGMKTVQLLWRRVWRFPKKLGIELPYNSAYKGLYSQSYGFTSSHIWMWELDNIKGWEPKNWCFWTVVLEKTLRVPWTAKRSNQSILKEISPAYSLEGLMLKLKLQYFGHPWELTDWKRPWSWERLKAGWEGDDRGWDGWMASLTQWTSVWPSSGSRRWTGKPSVLQSVGSQSQTWLSNWSDWWYTVGPCCLPLLNIITGIY